MTLTKLNFSRPSPVDAWMRVLTLLLMLTRGMIVYVTENIHIQRIYYPAGAKYDQYGFLRLESAVSYA